MLPSLNGLSSASKEHLDTLLGLLGSRARDFNLCFNMDSPWCYKYAYIVLNGMYPRDIPYTQKHHIIPYAYYKWMGVNEHNRSKRVSLGNLTVLSFGEHTYAHYCILHCITDSLRPKMIKAFFTLFYGFREGRLLFSRAYLNGIVGIPETYEVLSRLDCIEESYIQTCVFIKEHPTPCRKRKARRPYMKYVYRPIVPITYGIERVIKLLHEYLTSLHTESTMETPHNYISGLPVVCYTFEDISLGLVKLLYATQKHIAPFKKKSRVFNKKSRKPLKTMSLRDKILLAFHNVKQGHPYKKSILVKGASGVNGLGNSLYMMNLS